VHKRIFKDKVYSLLAKMIQAMANPRRLEIIDLLGQGEKSVDQLAKETHMAIANASQHLQVLKAANLVDVRREGNFIYYRLAHEEIYKSWQTMRQLGLERIAEMEKIIKEFREKPNGLEEVKINDLVTRMNSRNIVLLDVRPASEYDAGHIPDAISIPVDELTHQLKKLPKNKEYIAYCRGPFCVFADDAVNILLKKGFRAKRLAEGFPDWKLKGLPVEATK
jgi:rhodanese-related sulfurtransferase/DNA-binding transcriptional ArsR family regulator